MVSNTWIRDIKTTRNQCVHSDNKKQKTQNLFEKLWYSFNIQSNYSLDEKYCQILVWKYEDVLSLEKCAFYNMQTLSNLNDKTSAKSKNVLYFKRTRLSKIEIKS